MTISVLKSKIHLARVTDTRLTYNGSLEVDPDIFEEAGIVAYEKVLVGNMTNGQRFETYIIPGTRGSRVVSPNGGVARLCERGDQLVVMSFAQIEPGESLVPKVIVLDEHNTIVERPDYRLD